MGTSRLSAWRSAGVTRESADPGSGESRGGRDLPFMASFPLFSESLRSLLPTSTAASLRPTRKSQRLATRRTWLLMQHVLQARLYRPACSALSLQIHASAQVRRSVHTGSQHGLPIPPALQTLENAEQSAQARTWIDKFKSHEIPKGSVEFTYSRSSGPGGQV